MKVKYLEHLHPDVIEDLRNSILNVYEIETGTKLEKNEIKLVGTDDKMPIFEMEDEVYQILLDAGCDLTMI
jgi:hypothetical protein